MKTILANLLWNCFYLSSSNDVSYHCILSFFIIIPGLFVQSACKWFYSAHIFGVSLLSSSLYILLLFFASEQLLCIILSIGGCQINSGWDWEKSFYVVCSILKFILALQKAWSRREIGMAKWQVVLPSDTPLKKMVASYYLQGLFMINHQLEHVCRPFLRMLTNFPCHGSAVKAQFSSTISFSYPKISGSEKETAE